MSFFIVFPLQKTYKVEDYEEEEAPENRTSNRSFPSLEELLVSIFNKVADLKSLCRCSLVSKHFAYVIPHVQTVSVFISGNGAYTGESLQIMGKLMSGLLHSDEPIPTLLESLSLQQLKLPTFLEKFRKLERVHLEYEYPENGESSSFPTWKIKFIDESAMIDSFVALVPGSIHKDTEYDEADQDEPDQAYSSVMTRITECFWLFYGRYLEWICRILLLVKSHTSLLEVTITDSEKQGKLVVRDEQLNIGCRIIHELLDRLSHNILRVAWLPVLHLPLSGYMLRWTTMVIIHAPSGTQDESAKKLDEFMFGEFEDGLTVLREAVKGVLKDHKEKIKIMGELTHVENE